MSLSRLNHWLPGREAHPDVLQRTAAFPRAITDAVLPQPDPVLSDTAALDAAVDMLAPPPTVVQDLGGPLLFQRQRLPAWFLRRPEALPLRERQRQAAPSLQQPAPRGPGRRRHVSHGLLMDATARGVAQAEEEEPRMHSQDICHGVVLVLAALTPRRLHRVLGADEAPCGAIRGTRGDAGAAAGTATTGPAASVRGVIPVAASSSETPSRGARAVRERAGASPRARSAASSAGRRTCIHWLALLWTIPNKRPCTTWRAYVFRETRMNKRRSAGVGRGQFWYTRNWRAV